MVRFIRNVLVIHAMPCHMKDEACNGKLLYVMSSAVSGWNVISVAASALLGEKSFWVCKRKKCGLLLRQLDVFVYLCLVPAPRPSSERAVGTGTAFSGKAFISAWFLAHQNLANSKS